jgi:lipopolysaccharide export system permease protein
VALTQRAPFAGVGLDDFKRVTILDRYVVREFSGPFVLGLAAFTLIFVATQILAIGKLVTEQHASLAAAIEYFLWDMPQFLLLVVPMAVLFGTLLTMQRLSGESEITAMMAGGISLQRIIVPLAVVGVIISLLALLVQEGLVPLANDRAAYIREEVIEHLSPAASNLTYVTPLPGGGKQVTIAGALDPQTQSLLNVTVLQYDNKSRLSAMIVSRQASYEDRSWTFLNATTYRFGPAGDLSETMQTPGTMVVDIGGKPNQLAKRNFSTQDPENLSRAEIASALATNALSDAQRRSFEATYAAKLARPFSSFVFVLFAAPLGLRRVRGGGTPLGFGLAVVIVFVYYVITTLFLSIGSSASWLAGIAAWTPIVIFGAIGIWLLRRATSSQ